MATITVDEVVVALEARVNEYERRLLRAEQTFNRSVGGMQRSAVRSETAINQSFNTIGRSAVRLGQVVAAGLVTRAIREYADAWTVAENKIAAGALVSGIAGSNLSKIADSAIEARTAFEGYTELYARFLRTGGQVAATQEQIAVATNIAAKAFKAGGATAREQAAAVIQLGQALGSGFIAGDELRSVRENAPLIAQAIAEEFKTTIGGLKQLGAEGKITSDRVFLAILKAQKEIEAQFAVTNPTIADGFNNLRTSLIRFVADVDDSVGATQGLVSALNVLANNLDGIAAAAATAGVAFSNAFARRNLVGGANALSAAIAAEVKYNAAVLRGSAVQLNSAQATAQKAVSAKAAAAAVLDQANASKAAAAANLQQLRADLALNAEQIKRAQLQARQAKAYFELQNGLRVAGQATQSLSTAQASYNASTRTLLVYQRRQRELTAAVTAAENAYTAATVRATEATGAYAVATGAATRATAALSVAARLATVGMTIFTRVLSLFGGPLGVVLIAATALATGLIDLGGAAITTSGAIEKLQSAVSDAESTISDLGQTQARIDSDTNKLKETNEKLAKAIEAGGDAAIAAANAEAAAIQARIKNNEALKQTYVDLLKAQRASAGADLSVAQGNFRRDFGGGLSLGESLIAGLPLFGYQEDLLNKKDIIERQKSAAEAALAAARQSVAEGTAGGDEQAILRADAEIKSLVVRIGDLDQALEELNNTGRLTTEKIDTSNLVTPLGVGNRGSQSKEKLDAFEREIRRLTEGIAEFRAEAGAISGLNPDVDKYRVAVERAVVEARLLNMAQRAGLEITPALRAQVAELARTYSTLSDVSEQSRAFGGLVTSVQEDIESIQTQTAVLKEAKPEFLDFGQSLATVAAEQELLASAQRAGIELTPELLSAIQALAERYGLYVGELNKAKEANERLNNVQQQVSSTSKDVLKGFITDLRDGKSAADALADALDKIADKLLDIALDSLFQTSAAKGFSGFISSLLVSGAASGGVFAYGAPAGQPLKQFGRGGVSNEAAVFAEAGPEAAVPLPDGRQIPVDLKISDTLKKGTKSETGNVTHVNVGGIHIEGVRDYNSFRAAKAHVYADISKVISDAASRGNA